MSFSRNKLLGMFLIIGSIIFAFIALHFTGGIDLGQMFSFIAPQIRSCGFLDIFCEIGNLFAPMAWILGLIAGVVAGLIIFLILFAWREAIPMWVSGMLAAIIAFAIFFLVNIAFWQMIILIVILIPILVVVLIVVSAVKGFIPKK